jgi:hypothetical protein
MSALPPIADISSGYVWRSSSGSFATLAAIRRASSRDEQLDWQWRIETKVEKNRKHADCLFYAAAENRYRITTTLTTSQLLRVAWL